MITPRRVAFDVLYEIETDAAYSSIVINKVLNDKKLGKLDSSFASALIYGVLEKKITLDYIIRSYSSLRIKKIEINTLVLLRMGVYQLLFMDRVPESAAVNETVKLSKALGLYKSSGFINGILRSIARAEEKYNFENITDKNKYFSVKYSVPQNIAEMWISSYGIGVTVSMMEKLSGRPPLYARVNTLVTTGDKLISDLKRENVIAEKTPLETTLKISNTGSIEHLKSFKQGKFYIQDISSNTAVTVLAPKINGVVYDVCSAPGGKSFSSSLIMEGTGSVNSFDLYEHKIRLVNDGAKRLGIKNINASVKNALHNTQRQVADAVICDVPCSGLGLIRRKPEIRYKDNLLDNSLPEIQYSILHSSAKLVKSGGYLMYSTCTLNPDENNRVTEKFLARHREFNGVDIILPKNIKRTIQENPYECTLFPQTNDSDGFYFAILRKD